MKLEQQINKYYDSLTPNEQYICECILNHKNDCIRLSIDEFAIKYHYIFFFKGIRYITDRHYISHVFQKLLYIITRNAFFPSFIRESDFYHFIPSLLLTQFINMKLNVIPILNPNDIFMGQGLIIISIH